MRVILLAGILAPFNTHTPIYINIDNGRTYMTLALIDNNTARASRIESALQVLDVPIQRYTSLADVISAYRVTNTTKVVLAHASQCRDTTIFNTAHNTTKLIIYSEHVTENDFIKTLRPEVYYYLQEPYTPQHLCAIARVALHAA